MEKCTPRPDAGLPAATTTQPSEMVFTELAVEHQLITASLRHLRCSGQFVEKENARSGNRQKLRWHPLRLIGSNAWQPAKIYRVKLNSSNVEELPV